MPLASQATEDFSGGIYGGRKSPPNAIYDCVNGLIDDEGLIYRRGGTAYFSITETAEPTSRLRTAQFSGPDKNRVLTWGTKLYVLDDSDAPLEIYDFGADIPGRPVNASGTLVFPTSPLISTLKFNRFVYYGGSLLPAGGSVDEGTITVTAGSTAVTKSGGATWVGAIDPGMFINGITGQPYGIVRSVDGANALTLVSGWTGATTSTATYTISATILAAMAVDGIPTTNNLHMASAGQRLLATVGNRVYVSNRGFPFGFDIADYHELPVATEISGIEGLGDTAIVFGSTGAWGITNLALDIFNAYGDIQQGVEQVNGDVILWGDLGITPWAGNGMIVPAVDDVYLIAPGQPAVSLTGDASNEKVRRRYRSYSAQDGYQPGMTAIHRGHLFLPILAFNVVVDVLVCRLDRGAAWTRWLGGAASTAYAVRPGSADEPPVLLGLHDDRVTDLAGCFDPDAGNALDANGGTSDFVLDTRDMPTGGNQPGFAQRLRARYEMVGVESSTTDDFERANETPLASPYLNWFTGGKPNLVSGSAVDSGAFVSSTTRPESLSPNCTVEATFDAQAVQDGFTYYFLGARLMTHSNSANGYQFRLEPGTGSGWKATIRSGGAQATIKTSTVTNWLDISGFRLVCQGNVLTGYLKVSGDWTEVVSTTDGTYTAGGYVGFGLSTFFGSPVGFEDFSWTEGPSVTVAFSSDQDDDVFTDLTDRGEQDGGGGWGESDGSLYQWALVGKRRERIRFRLRLSGATASFVLRSLEMLTRPSGKQ